MSIKKQNIFDSARNTLDRYAALSSTALVAFSGGKDSRVILDLCCRAFSRVVCYTMRFIREMQEPQSRIDWAREKYGVEVIEVIHPDFFNCKRQGIFCKPMPDLPEFNVYHIDHLLMQEVGVTFVVKGIKKSDGLWRQRQLRANKKKEGHCVYPLADWMKYDVLAYLKSKDIPIPEGGKVSNMTSPLTISGAIELHDSHPEDYRIVKKYFPYVDAVIKRHNWYGQKESEEIPAGSAA